MPVRAGQHVVAAAAGDALDVGLDGVVLAGLAVVGGAVGIGGDRRRAGRVVGGVGARPAEQQVGAGAAVEDVVAGAAVEDVGAAPSRSGGRWPSRR